MNIEILKQHGVDYEAGLRRCMGDRQFYERMLCMFLDDTAYQRAEAAYQAGNNEELFRCAHELKGACGNVDLAELYEVDCRLVELLRGGNAERANVDELFTAVTTAYDRVIRGIRLAGEE